MTTSMTLCFAPGSCSRVPLIALEEIGVPFETRLIAFMAQEHRSADYLAINPSGKVPVLITANGAVTQNPAILWYLARTFPEAGLLPAAETMQQEAQYLGRLMRFSSDIHPLVTRFVMPHFFCDVLDAHADIRTKAGDALAGQLSGIEAQLAQTNWLLGDDIWSILDAYLFWVWLRITGAGFDGSAFPSIARHHAAMHQRPSVQRALAREQIAMDQLAERGLAVPMPR